MAHHEQHTFFLEASRRFSNYFQNADKILEVGSQNINGTVRGFFPNAKEYLGIDLGQGSCVDWVVPGELIELPDSWADIVISTECFEHCKDWDKALINMIRILKPCGLILITCAGIGRRTHGTIDSELDSSPFTPTYYKNLGIDDISSKIATGLYFTRHSFEINSSIKDLYFWGIRSNSDIDALDEYWEDPMSRLARAQGQLGQAAARQASIQVELIQISTKADQAKAEADQAKAEVDQAKAEVDQAKAEVDQAKAEVDQAKAEVDQAKAETRQMEDQLNTIKASKIWRLTEKLRIVLDSYKRLLKS